jgi:hypothetical protein
VFKFTGNWVRSSGFTGCWPGIWTSFTSDVASLSSFFSAKFCFRRDAASPRVSSVIFGTPLIKIRIKLTNKTAHLLVNVETCAASSWWARIRSRS